MISKQKAKRIAYGAVSRALGDIELPLPLVGPWDDDDRLIIQNEIDRILNDLLKRSQ